MNWRTAAPASSRRRSAGSAAAFARDDDRGADPGLQGRTGTRWSTVLARAAGDPEPQHGDGAAPLLGGAAAGTLRALARTAATRARRWTPGTLTKSGLMVGLGETREELLRRVRGTSRANHVDILTVGQYLRPTPEHLPVERYWHARGVRRDLKRRREGDGLPPRGVRAAGAQFLPRGGAGGGRGAATCRKRRRSRYSAYDRAGARTFGEPLG